LVSWSWLAWWRPPCLLRVVIVNLKDDPDAALRGVMWSARGSWLVLRQATALTSTQPPAPIDGEVLVHRSNVSFIQMLPP
jgi:hypothetical protein